MQKKKILFLTFSQGNGHLEDEEIGRERCDKEQRKIIINRFPKEERGGKRSTSTRDKQIQ